MLAGSSEREQRNSGEPSPTMVLLWELPPWWLAFRRNARDLVLPRAEEPLELESAPAAFWTDVFVRQGVAWRRMAESVFYHAAAFALVLAVLRAMPRPLEPALHSFDQSSVLYYDASEYLPAVNTGAKPARPQQGDPVYARQEIISVPPEADNRSQTIVTPPDIKLKQDVALPNIVAWTRSPGPVPMAATRALPLDATMLAAPVAPAPEMEARNRRDVQSLAANAVAPAMESAEVRNLRTPGYTGAVIGPPPAVSQTPSRRLSDINIGRSEVVNPAPQLPVEQQRALYGRGGGSAGSPGTPRVVAPPQAIAGAGTGVGSGRIIALSVNPSLKMPSELPAGNRRGSFAAGPDGKPGNSGTPHVTGAAAGAGGGGDGHASGAGNGTGAAGLPAGIYVGAGPVSHPTSAVAGAPSRASLAPPAPQPVVVAKAAPAKITGPVGRAARPIDEAKVTDVDKQVFGIRKFYSMSLNMPNLNSAGGSWVIRFAEKKQEETAGELTAPVATQKVDPAYPIELMRQNVAGTVTLYAVIHSDGSVGEVKVLASPDDRLDRYARRALERCRFQPATKAGSAVDLEAVVLIPFRPGRSAF